MYLLCIMLSLCVVTISEGQHRLHPEDGQQMVTVSTSWLFLELDSADAYAFRHGEVDVGDVKVKSAVEDGEEAESEGERILSCMGV